MSDRDEAQAREVPQQRHRGRPRQAQAVDPARARFKTLKTAYATYATTKGFEVMRALRKGQAGHFTIQDGFVGEARLVQPAFGLIPCALTEVMVLLQDRLASAET